MNSDKLKTSMEIIISALRERGYDPYAQLCGYLKENNLLYITKYKNARNLIQSLDKKQIERYIVRHMK